MHPNVGAMKVNHEVVFDVAGDFNKELLVLRTKDMSKDFGSGMIQEQITDFRGSSTKDMNIRLGRENQYGVDIKFSSDRSRDSSVEDEEKGLNKQGLLTKLQIENALHLSQQEAAKQYACCVSTVKRAFKKYYSGHRWPSSKKRYQMNEHQGRMRRRMQTVIDNLEREFEYIIDYENLENFLLPFTDSRGLQSVCNSSNSSSSKSSNSSMKNSNTNETIEIFNGSLTYFDSNSDSLLRNEFKNGISSRNFDIIPEGLNADNLQNSLHFQVDEDSNHFEENYDTEEIHDSTKRNINFRNDDVNSLRKLSRLSKEKIASNNIISNVLKLTKQNNETQKTQSNNDTFIGKLNKKKVNHDTNRIIQVVDSTSPSAVEPILKLERENLQLKKELLDREEKINELETRMIALHSDTSSLESVDETLNPMQSDNSSEDFLGLLTPGFYGDVYRINGPWISIAEDKRDHTIILLCDYEMSIAACSKSFLYIFECDSDELIQSESPPSLFTFMLEGIHQQLFVDVCKLFLQSHVNRIIYTDTWKATTSNNLYLFTVAIEKFNGCLWIKCLPAPIRSDTVTIDDNIIQKTFTAPTEDQDKGNTHSLVLDMIDTLLLIWKQLKTRSFACNEKIPTETEPIPLVQ